MVPRLFPALVVTLLLTASGIAAPPLLVAFGDSVTEGYGVAAEESYPAQLAAALKARGRPVRLVNAGVSGDTSGNALDRLEQVAALKPDVVILEIGGNDGLRGLPLDTTRRNIDRILAGLVKTGARVILVGMTLPANYGAAYVRQFERIYSDLAARHKARLAPVAAAGIAGKPGMMQRDGIHPTARGHRKLADLLLPHAAATLLR